jgi:hypothetical protein
LAGASVRGPAARASQLAARAPRQPADIGDLFYQWLVRMRAPLGLLGEVAARDMRRTDVVERRVLDRTTLP